MSGTDVAHGAGARGGEREKRDEDGWGAVREREREGRERERERGREKERCGLPDAGAARGCGGPRADAVVDRAAGLVQRVAELRKCVVARAAAAVTQGMHAWHWTACIGEGNTRSACAQAVRMYLTAQVACRKGKV